MKPQNGDIVKIKDEWHLVLEACDSDSIIHVYSLKTNESKYITKDSEIKSIYRKIK
jgi:hypothetical protein